MTDTDYGEGGDPPTDEPFDEVTGELLPEPPKVVSSSLSLLAAIHKIVTELPVWITQDAEAKVSDNRRQKYATLKAVMMVVRPIALRHGVRIKQNCEHAWEYSSGSAKGRMVPIYTDLILSATGEAERTKVEIPLARMDAQGMGSAISYGRRYCLLLALGLTTDDAAEDDGEATKARPNIMRERVDSNALLSFREEVDSFDDFKKLKEWGEKLAQGHRLEVLDDVEAELLRNYFAGVLRKLAASEKEKPVKTTKPKGE